MKITTSKSDYVWSYFAYIMKFGVNLFIFPLVLHLLPTAEYGLWVTFSSIGTIINLFDFGFSSTILRNMTFVWSGAQTIQAEGCVVQNSNAVRNDRLFVLTFRTCRRIYFIIAIISLLVSFTAGSGYIFYITRDIFDYRYLLAWMIYSLSIGLNLYYAYWTVSLKSIGAIKQAQKAVVISIALQLIISYAGLLCGFGILALSVAACICGVVVRVVSRVYFVRCSNILEISNRYKRDIAKSEISETFKIIWYNARKAGVSSIATVSLTQSTTLICSAYLGMEVAGTYGLCLQILNMLSGVAQIYYQTTIPLLTQARHQGDLPKCRKLFSVSSTVSFYIFISGVAFVVICGTPLLRLIGSQTHLNIPLFSVMALYIFGEMVYSMHASFISLENKLPFVPSVVITAVIIIPLSLLVAYCDLGIWWLLGVRIIIESLYIFWKWPLTAHKQLKCNMWMLLQLGTKEIIESIKKETRTKN